MSASLNPALTNSFEVVITDANVDSPISYFVRSVTIPGVSMPGADANYQRHPTPMPSNSRNRETLGIEFILSEDYSNYHFFKKWAFVAEFGEGDITEAMKDIAVIILSSNKTPIAKFSYKNCAPSDISPLTLEHGAIDAQPQSFTVNFLFMEEVFT